MNIEFEMFWFRKHKNTKYADYYAMETIQVFIKANEVIPEELMPWVEKACNVFTKSLSSTRKPKHVTRIVQNRVIEVHMLRSFIGSRDEAIRLISNRDGIKTSTMLRNYQNEAKYGADKLEIEKLVNRFMESREMDVYGGDYQFIGEMFDLPDLSPDQFAECMDQDLDASNLF